MKTMFHSMTAICAMVMLLFTSGCEDPVPTDYKEEILLEGLLIVGEPLENVRILRTLPVTDTFSFERASIPDATIIVRADGVDVPMEFVADPRGGTYRAIDTAYRVKPNVVYSVTVNARGAELSASTRTPAPFEYTAPPRPWLRYPSPDSLLVSVDDSLLISWTGVQGTDLYIISITCLDTLGYGQYLQPPTSEANSRTIRPNPDFFDQSGTLLANERTTLGVTRFTTTQTVWGVFRWYGPHEIRIYAPDRAFLEWIDLVGSGRRSSYDYQQSNVRGGLGAWGSASMVKQRTFLLKRDTR